jgi:hypothetical protein
MPRTRARMGRVAFGLALAGLVAAAPSAFGATRYAAVAGTGDPTTCLESNPCNLDDAVEHASVQNGDEVVVGPGTYDLVTGTVTVDNSIDLHGASGGPRPKITTASTTNFTGAVTITAGGPTVHDLELENTGASGAAGIYSASFGGVVAERLVVTSTQGAPACEVFFGTLRDSVCRNTGSGAGMLLPLGSTPGTLTLNLRNVTSVAEGSSAFSDGIIIFASGSGFNYVVDAKNTIALGGTFDARADQSGGATASINFENSNYDSVDPTGAGTVTAPGTGTGNQAAAPVFENQAGGDYHQTPASPTLDAGASVALLGTSDFDGDARSIDGNCDDSAQPDIGVDELAVCAAPNNNFANAQVLSGSTATANGTNVSATEEPGEDFYATEDVDNSNPTVTRSVWYRWTSPGDGPATVDVCTGNNFDTMLAVFSGSALGALSLVGANNNHADCPPGSFASKVSFAATQDTTYQIVVDGCCGLPSGDFSLNVSGPAAPPPPPDVTPPDTRITQGPKPRTKKRRATFKFSSTESGSTFRCKLDRGRFRVCSSPSRARVKKGKHRFKVRAIDAAGNPDPTPATWAWKVK